MPKFLKILFVFLLVVLTASFFERDNYKNIKQFINYLYFFSFYGLVALIFSRIIYFFWEVVKK